MHEPKTVIILQDLFKRFSIEVVEVNNSYGVYEYEKKICKSYVFCGSSENMILYFMDLYKSYKLVDQIHLIVVRDDFGLNLKTGKKSV